MKKKGVIVDPVKSDIDGSDEELTVVGMGFSYYAFCLEQSLTNLLQARRLVKGDVVDENHELARIEDLLREALAAV